LGAGDNAQLAAELILNQQNIMYIEGDDDIPLFRLVFETNTKEFEVRTLNGCYNIVDYMAGLARLRQGLSAEIGTEKSRVIIGVVDLDQRLQEEIDYLLSINVYAIRYSSMEGILASPLCRQIYMQKYGPELEQVAPIHQIICVINYVRILPWQICQCLSGMYMYMSIG
jgi:hypothetical protein